MTEEGRIYQKTEEAAEGGGRRGGSGRRHKQFIVLIKHERLTDPGSAGSAELALRWTVVPFVTDFLDPVDVVGHFGVDAQLLHVAAALAPGHQPHQEPGVSVERDHGAAAVPLTGVRPLAQDAGAQHVSGDVVGHVLAADAAVHQGDFDDVEGGAEPGAFLVLFAPAAHHRHGAVPVEDPLGQAAPGETDGDDVVGQGGGGLQAKQADVVVRRLAVVPRVFEGFGDLQGDLGSFSSETLVVT